MRLDEILKEATTVGISGHVRPDGDCVGSCMAMYQYIKTKYPLIDVHVYLEEIPNIFSFLAGTNDIEDASNCDRKHDLFIALDCGDGSRLGASNSLFLEADNTVCIDHHISNQAFAKENYIVPDASSTCELVYHVLDKEFVTKEIAEAIYVGIIHDTGMFQYSCTTEETMEIAGKLMAMGIDFPRIANDTFFASSFIQNKMLGMALMNSTTYVNGRIICSVITLKEMSQYNAKPKHLEGIVSHMRATTGVEVAVFLYENTDHTFKASLRASNEVDVAAIAMTYGGGGHKKAAGATLAYEKPEILIEKLVMQIKEQLD